MTFTIREIQQHVGVPTDGMWGPTTAEAVGKALGMVAPAPFDRATFLARYINRDAPAIDDLDRKAAAMVLKCSVAHIRAIEKVESNGTSFDQSGRPVILFEPHIFYRLTGGRYGSTSFSSKSWNRALYPKSYDGRWQQMADAAALDEDAALQSASWGLFQVMGFHYAACGFKTPQDYAAAMTADEDNHLEAMVSFIQSEGLDDELRACKAGNPASCVPFVSRYNGPGYKANNYHVKFANALRG